MSLSATYNTFGFRQRIIVRKRRWTTIRMSRRYVIDPVVLRVAMSHRIGTMRNAIRYITAFGGHQLFKININALRFYVIRIKTRRCVCGCVCVCVCVCVRVFYKDIYILWRNTRRFYYKTSMFISNENIFIYLYTI